MVSDEVRKLAERTQSCTSEIQGMMAGMIKSNDALAARMVAVVGQVASGVRNATEAGQSMERIVADAARVGEVVGEISTGLGEQSIAANDISRHVERISRMTEGSAALTALVSREVDGLRDVSTALTGIVERFRIPAASA